MSNGRNKEADGMFEILDSNQMTAPGPLTTAAKQFFVATPWITDGCI